MSEKMFCIVTPQARTYYKAAELAKEFLDKDNNVVNTTGAIPDGEIVEITAPSITKKHFEQGKLHGTLEVIDLAENLVTFSEEYNHGQLVRVSDHTTPTLPTVPAKTQEAAPIYQGTLLKTTKDVRLFYVNGKQVAEETLSANGATLELLGNIPDGEVKEFGEGGKLKAEGTYQNNKLHGVLITYDDQGRTLSKETYDQGILKGPAQYFSYTRDDVFQTDCNYKSTLLDGPFTLRQQNGTVREQALYLRGRLQGQHLTYYAGGAKEVEETYQDGKLQGKRTIYFPTGEVWYEEHYQNGRLEGDRTEYFPSGQVRMSEFYADGMLNGQRNTYSQSGDLLTSEEYHWGNIMHNTEYRPK